MNTWRWNIIPALLAEAFAEKPDIPLPIWASQNVRLDRRMTTRPGYYDPDEYAWTWEFQEIGRRRQIFEKTLEDGAVVICDPLINLPVPVLAERKSSQGESPLNGSGEARESTNLTFTDGVALPDVKSDSRGGQKISSMRVHQIDVMKGTQTGCTEGALNLIRFCAAHDPQNIIFAIDKAQQAGEVNEIRLQPTLRDLGQQIFTDDNDDAAKFILKLRRMIIYFLGSYSEASLTQKFCELGVNDELEEHGSPDSVEDMLSRMKSSERWLLINMSKPKFAGGPIDREYRLGSMHVAEIPCPNCTEANGGIPAGFQQLDQDNMKFSHCKNILGEWDFDRVQRETYFECIHCHQPIEEHHKRWFNDRTRRRWRRTNFEKAQPGHISFHLPDFFSYHQSVSWGNLAIKYINAKGDPEKRRTYRNHHEGLPYEQKIIKLEISNILALRDSYPRGVSPWLPRAIVLGADVGLGYVKWVVLAMRITADHHGEAALMDYGLVREPEDLLQILSKQTYLCAEDQKSYPITIGGVDEKYQTLKVQQACLKSQRRLWPTAGIGSDVTIRSIGFTHIPGAPPWFGFINYNDRDAKHDLYTDRIGSWAHWRELGCPADPALAPSGPPLHYFQELSDAPNSPHLEFLNEHTKERLVEVPGAHARRQFIFKRFGPNHWPDAIKVALVMWRYFTAPE